MSFGKRLNQILLDRDMTPAELSRMLGWNTGVLSQYLNNPKRDPRLSTAIKIADALGVSLDYLAGRESPPPQPAYADPRQRRMNEAYDQMSDLMKDAAAGSVVSMLGAESARIEGASETGVEKRSA